MALKGMIAMVVVVVVVGLMMMMVEVAETRVIDPENDVETPAERQRWPFVPKAVREILKGLIKHRPKPNDVTKDQDHVSDDVAALTPIDETHNDKGDYLQAANTNPSNRKRRSAYSYNYRNDDSDEVHDNSEEDDDSSDEDDFLGVDNYGWAGRRGYGRGYGSRGGSWHGCGGFGCRRGGHAYPRYPQRRLGHRGYPNRDRYRGLGIGNGNARYDIRGDDDDDDDDDNVNFHRRFAGYGDVPDFQPVYYGPGNSYHGDDDGYDYGPGSGHRYHHHNHRPHHYHRHGGFPSRHRPRW